MGFLVFSDNIGCLPDFFMPFTPVSAIPAEIRHIPRRGPDKSAGACGGSFVSRAKRVIMIVSPHGFPLSTP
ncbi:hypothetical protein ACPRNU_06555 [Chromobacterium vaccinii]|uniref:hypothetical protein n=1 Tax=Chromobacterium vaccinii TaxID=1108595 RepID=UPI003C77AC21